MGFSLLGHLGTRPETTPWASYLAGTARFWCHSKLPKMPKNCNINCTSRRSQIVSHPNTMVIIIRRGPCSTEEAFLHPWHQPRVWTLNISYAKFFLFIAQFVFCIEYLDRTHLVLGNGFLKCSFFFFSTSLFYPLSPVRHFLPSFPHRLALSTGAW